MSNSTVRAGAAYEAVLTDNVTPKVNDIVQSLDRLKAAFQSVNGPAQAFNQSMAGISGSLQGMGGQLGNYARRQQDIAKTIAVSAGFISTAGVSIGQSLFHIGNKMKNIGLASIAGGIGLGTGLMDAARQFSSAQETLSAFNQVFGQTADSMNKWAEGFAKKTGRSLTDVRENLISFQGIFSELDAPADQVNDLAKAMQQLTLDFGAATGLADEDAMLKMLSAMSGEGQVLMRYGINVKDAGIEQHNLAVQMGLTAEKMTEQEKILFRYLTISERMKEKGFIGQLQRESGSFPNQMARLTSAFRSLREEVGKLVMPEVIAFIQGLREAILSVVPHVEALKERLVGMSFVGVGIGGILFVVGQALNILGPIFIAVTTGVGGAVIAAINFVTLLIEVAAVSGLAAGLILHLSAAFLVFGAGMVYVIARSFPLMETLDNLTNMFRELGTMASASAIAIKNAMVAQNFNDAWKIFKVTGQLAILEIAGFFRQMIIDAFTSAWDFIVEQTYRAFEPLWPEGLTGIKIPKRPEDNSESWAEMQIRLVKELAMLVGKYRTPPEKKDSEFFTGEQRNPDMYGPVQEKIADEQKDILRRMQSMGTFSGLVASQASSFGPVFDPIEKESKEQTHLQKQILNEAMKLNENILGIKSETLVFGP